MLRTLTIAMLLAAGAGVVAQPAKRAFDAKAARRDFAREALVAAKKDCATLIETRRDSEPNATIADCLSNDSFTILRYRIRAGQTSTEPASIELLPTPS